MERVGGGGHRLEYAGDKESLLRVRARGLDEMESPMQAFCGDDVRLKCLSGIFFRLEWGGGITEAGN